MTKRVLTLFVLVVFALGLFTGCMGNSAYVCQDLTIDVPVDIQDLSKEPENKNYDFYLTSTNYSISGERSAKADLAEISYLGDFGAKMLSEHGISGAFMARSGQDYLYCTYTREVSHVSYAAVSAVYQAEESFWFLTVLYPAEGFGEDFAFSFLDTVRF